MTLARFVPSAARSAARSLWLAAKGVARMPEDPHELPPGPWRRAEDGVVAEGGDLRPERLLSCYSKGLFPWPAQDGTLLWHSPDPRYVIDLSSFRIPKEAGRLLRQGRFRITLDRAFEEVIRAAASVERRGGDRSWISGALIDAWCELHQRGHAHSLECWSGDTLVGGSYGLAVGAAFFGESSFTRAKNAGSVGFAAMFTHLRAQGFAFVDCQVRSAHLEQFGQVGWSRDVFLARLAEAAARPSVPPPAWQWRAAS